MPEIDWDKPVEYACDSVISPVLGTVTDRRGRRYAVIEHPRDGVVTRCIDHGYVPGTYRNVRRKVKHRSVEYVNLYPNGVRTLHGTRKNADECSVGCGRVECREIVIEWEVEVDE